MVRQQMFCLVTPRWTGAAAAVPALKEALDALLEGLGCVHFASVAVLPPRPDEPAGALPSLMLELAVDEGLATPQVLELLVARGLEALWPLYQGYADASLPPHREARARWLRDWLAQHTFGADGGYVGARDRTVEQIRQEHALYRAARAQAALLTANERLDSDWLALKLSAWANDTREYDWARHPAPRSFWRRGGLQRILAIVGGVMALLAAGMAAAWLIEPLCLSWAWQWPALVSATVVVLLAGGIAAALLAPVWLTIVTALPRVWRPVSQAIKRWDRTRHARATREVPRAHQVHPMVARCEADLIDRPNHIISLTEIRMPHAWHGRWLRLWLRVITWAGRWAFARGVLGKANGIKYGHWHLVDDGRRLLFCSNYDGSFGGYLGEFIAGATVGVNLFWRRTRLLPRSAAAPGHPAVAFARDFPPTRCLAWHGGCEHEQWFKTYARDSMLPHLYLYQAYRYSQAEIERATALRDALFGPRNPVNDDILAKAVES
jgi:hypothetical protein